MLGRFRSLAYFAALFALAAVASAHPMLQNKLWVLLTPGAMKVAVDVSVKEISVAQLLQPESDGQFDSDLLATAAEYHGDYVLRHLQITADGKPIVGHVTKVSPPPQSAAPEDTFYQFELEYPLSDTPITAVTLRHSMLQEFPYGPGQAWDVNYSVRWRSDQQSPVQTSLLRMGQVVTLSKDTATMAPGASSAAAIGPMQTDVRRTFLEYLWHGVMHILTGYDHLLFITALILATATFWDMVKVIAAFTAAHTLTLTLSVLNVVRLPAAIVEPVIAGSIVFVALENVIFPKRTHSWVRLGVAFGFGLIHGLGFAGGLLQAMEGLPALSVGIAIVAFSLGVEAGHQAIVLPLFGALRLGRMRWTPLAHGRALRFASILVSLGGIYFLVHAIAAA